MYNLTNNKRRNLITSCSCSHFTMYRYYWYLFFFVFTEIAAFPHSLSLSLFLPLILSLSFSLSHHPWADHIAINSIFFACDYKKNKKEAKKPNERTNRLSSPNLRNCNLCSHAITHCGDLGGTGSGCGGRSLLDG